MVAEARDEEAMKEAKALRFNEAIFTGRDAFNEGNDLRGVSAKLGDGVCAAASRVYDKAKDADL